MQVCMKLNCSWLSTVLVDFSENYGCKYSEEVQSAHFGASKGQVTLHTGVLYLNGLNTVECQQGYGKQKQKCISFCSMSDSLRHDAAAVRAHLLPLLHLVKKQYVQVDTVRHSIGTRTISICSRILHASLGGSLPLGTCRKRAMAKGQQTGLVELLSAQLISVLLTAQTSRVLTC